MTALMLGVGILVLLLYALSGSSLPVARAGTIGDIDTTDDDVATNGNCTLREAIEAADTDMPVDQCSAGSGDDTIVVPAGTYTLTLTSGVSNRDFGDLDIYSSDALTLAGAGSASTLINADGIDRVLQIASGSGTVVISGATILGGQISGSGAGIYNADADLVLINSVVSDNVATGNGGGVYNSSGHLTLSGGQVISNSGMSGAGVWIGSGDLTIDGAYVLSNTASIFGGGVNVGSGNVDFVSGQVALNRGLNGAGIYVQDGLATISGGHVVSNTALAGGGGIYLYNGSAILSAGGIISNTADGGGGGVYVGNTSATFTQTGDSLISLNGAADGGGVYLWEGSAVLDAGEVRDNIATDGAGVHLRLAGARLTQGGSSVIEDNDAERYGGGIYIWRGSVTMSGGEIISNTACRRGGGVGVATTDAVFTQTGDSLIAYNVVSGQAVEDGGGGLYIDDGAASLTGGEVAHNLAQYGGGLFVSYGDATLNGGQMVSNTAGSGAGIYLYQSSANLYQSGSTLVAHNTATGTQSSEGGAGLYIRNGAASLSGAQFIENRSNSSRGGALVARFGSATLSGVDIESNSAEVGGGMYVYQGSVSVHGGGLISNTASQAGGGFYVEMGGSATLESAHVVANSATNNNGGGGYNSSGSVTMVNTTLSGNSSGYWGGGYYHGSGTTVFTYTTVAHNTAAANGDGIYFTNSGSFLVHNSIIANNGSVNCNYNLTSNDYNLEYGNTCGLNATNDITDTDPLLDPLSGVSDAILHPLGDGSPAIDQGSCVVGITADQRGVSRPEGVFCDIGAYEWIRLKVYLPLAMRGW